MQPPSLLFAELGQKELEDVTRLFKKRHFSTEDTLVKEAPARTLARWALIDEEQRSATITATNDLVCYGLT